MQQLAFAVLAGDFLVVVGGEDDVAGGGQVDRVPARDNPHTCVGPLHDLQDGDAAKRHLCKHVAARVEVLAFDLDDGAALA